MIIRFTILINLILSLISSTQYLTSNDFSTVCNGDDLNIEIKDKVQDWDILTYYPDPMDIKQGPLNSMYYFSSSHYPDQMTTGSYCFMELYGSCLGQTTTTTLTAGDYKLSFQYFEDHYAQQTIQISVIDITADSAIASHPVSFSLKNKELTYQKIIFTITQNTQVTVYICDVNGQGFTGVTSIHLNDWIHPSCTLGADQQAESTDNLLVCVLNSIVTGSINCYQYKLNSHSIYQCGACNQQTSIQKLISLDTNYKGCIDATNINYDSHCKVYEYTTDFKCLSCLYSTGETFNSLKVISGSSTLYKCPSDPALRQIYCVDYIMTQGGWSCKTCPYYLMKGTSGINVCIRDLIEHCNLYKPDTSCDPCSSGLPSSNKICPPTATTIILNCLSVTKFYDTYICLACMQGFVMNFKNQCIKQTSYCSNYRLNVCIMCINDYILKEGKCFRQIRGCLEIDQNGNCISCISGMIVKSRVCEKDNSNSVVIKCDSNQYVRNNICVNGSIQHCVKYGLLTGDCQSCVDKYKLGKNNKKCVLDCGDDSLNQKWVLKNGQCIKQDIRCQNEQDNGYCYECKQGYYAYMGLCYEVAFNSNNNEEGVVYRMLLDEQKNMNNKEQNYLRQQLK